MFLVPKSDATVLDTWQVNGLRGTASFSFEVDDVFVPESHTYLESDAPRDDSPIFVIPKIPLFSIGFATISVALARRCLDDAIELAGRKTQRGVSGAMIDRSTVHRQIGETEAGLRAADQYLRSSAAVLWESAREHGKVEMDARIEVRMASTHAIRHAAEVVDSAYELFGSGAIFKTNRIQRHYQDVHTIAQQIQGRATNFETAGRYFLGLELGGML
jgi:alkylation response protein AidB-like acyl-CoA dehydrogenase